MCYVGDEKGENVMSDGIQLLNHKVFKSLKERDSYNYLGVPEVDEVMVNEMKNKVERERERKVLETKLNSGNVFKALNAWAVSVVRYTAAFLGWSTLQIEDIDRRTRIWLTMHNGFHPKSNVD